MTLETARAPVVSVATYHADPLYARIECAVNAVLAKGNIVAPVDVMIGMDLLRPDQRRVAPRSGSVPGAGHRRQPAPPVAAAAHPALSRTRPEPQAVSHGLHATRQGCQAALALYQVR